MNGQDGRLCSIQIGTPQTYPEGPNGKPWSSAVDKRPVHGPLSVSVNGLERDHQVNRRSHGGKEKAILAYSADHYPVWQTELRDSGLTFGAFGENLTMANFTEQNVCIGDQWKIGSVLLEVSQPRQPCWKLAKIRRQPDLVKRIVDTCRSGWYLRVLTIGLIEAGQACQRVARPHAEWTVARASNVTYDATSDPAERAELVRLERLSPEWTKNLA